MSKPTNTPVPRAYLVNNRKKGAALPHSGTTYLTIRKPVAAKINYKAYKKAIQNTPVNISVAPPSSPTQHRRVISFHNLRNGLNRIVKILLPSAAYRTFFQKITTG